MSEAPLSLVCIEPRFPGRLGAVADWLVRKRGYRCRFFTAVVEPREHWPESTGNGLDVVPFGVGGVAREPQVAWNRCLERGLCYAYGCFEVLDAQRPRPVHLVLARSAGLGSSLFASTALPGVPIVNLFDTFHHPRRCDLDSEMPSEDFRWRQAANTMDLLDLENVTAAWLPTRWQRDLFPVEYRGSFTVLHDGIDTRLFRPSRSRPRTLMGRTLPAEARVVTFAARCLDRLRGFDRFWRLANALMRSDPNVIGIAVGGLAEPWAVEPAYDPERAWFPGFVAPRVLAEMLTASDLHVSPSRPYPVSRSLLEAMACGGVVMAADTEPVREFLEPGRHGLLLPGEDSDTWLSQAQAVLRDPSGHLPLGNAAMELIRQRYAQDVTLPELARHFDRLVSRPFASEWPVP